MHNAKLVSTILCGWACGVGGAALAQQRVSETVHNLSISGPGMVAAATETQVCIFCHAPHNTKGVRPLWNRELSIASYKIYESSTLNAKPGQPTGASKLCLSCHDGTIALGSVLSHADRIRMSGGDFIPAGLTNLGTDLSDDHPISFFYTAGLAAADRQLANPTALGTEVKLDAEGQLQCTSCHDAHDNQHGSFLVKRNEFSALCTTCHRMDGWQTCSHRSSGAVLTGVTLGDWPYSTVAENACRSCHRPHAAGGPQRLLVHEEEEDNCLNCHDGRVARLNIRAELDKLSAHDPRRYRGVHDPLAMDTQQRRAVECSDCHNPHAVSEQTPQTAYVSIGATMVKMRGVNIAGARIDEARHEYEVCFRCHAGAPASSNQRLTRYAQGGDLRLAFSPTNQSFHPVVGPATGRDTVSLAPGLTLGTMIRCTDCHNNDAGPGAGGNGPAGPHGSNYDYLLERNYTTTDGSGESESDYALCYKCHQRASILSDQSFPFHRRHIVEEQTPCSVCHDPHGISVTQSFGSDHTHLINFDVQIARPISGFGRPTFRDLGRFSGSCTLVCHGSTHDNRSYGIGGAP